MAARTVTVTELGHVPVSVAMGSAADGPALLRKEYERAPGQGTRRSQAAQGLRAREQLDAPRAEPVAACLRLARRHLLDRAYRDRPVRGGPVEAHPLPMTFEILQVQTEK